MTPITLVLVDLAYVAVPISLISGWIRWPRWRTQWSGLPAVSSIGFLTGSAPVLLALAALAHGRWEYYDPRLLKIYGLGMLISMAGLVFSFIGCFRRSHLRWQALLLSARDAFSLGRLGIHGIAPLQNCQRHSNSCNLL